MRENCFKQLFLDGKAERKDFDFHVKQWHEFGDGELHEFLGLSLKEMAVCVETPNKFYENLEHEKEHYEDFLRSLNEVEGDTVSREMAMDAGDLSLEGEVWK